MSEPAEDMAAYLEAYRAAWPDKDVPKLEYINGWVVFHHKAHGWTPTSRVRRAALAHMRDRLSALAKATERTP